VSAAAPFGRRLDCSVRKRTLVLMDGRIAYVLDADGAVMAESFGAPRPSFALAELNRAKMASRRTARVAFGVWRDGPLSFFRQPRSWPWSVERG
jgi:hypothetical protein